MKTWTKDAPDCWALRDGSRLLASVHELHNGRYRWECAVNRFADNLWWGFTETVDAAKVAAEAYLTSTYVPTHAG